VELFAGARGRIVRLVRRTGPADRN